MFQRELVQLVIDGAQKLNEMETKLENSESIDDVIASLESIDDVIAPGESIDDVNVSGTSLLPGYEHGGEAVGKRLSIHIFGTDAALLYSGNDARPKSGKLEQTSCTIRLHLKTVE